MKAIQWKLLLKFYSNINNVSESIWKLCGVANKRRNMKAINNEAILLLMVSVINNNNEKWRNESQY